MKNIYYAMDFDTIDSVNTNCLICYCSIKSSQFVIRSPQNSNKIFNVYCRLLKIELLGSMKWNLHEEALPFCDKCFRSVEEISVLYNQIEYIQGILSGILENTQLEILKSRSCKEQGFNSGIIGSNVELDRTDYFRLLAVRKYDPRVEISRDKISNSRFKLRWAKHVSKSKKEFLFPHPSDDESDLIPATLVKIEHDDTSSSPEYGSNNLESIERGDESQINNTTEHIPSPVWQEDCNNVDFGCSEYGSEFDTREASTVENAPISLRLKTHRKILEWNEDSDTDVSNEPEDPDYIPDEKELRNATESSTPKSQIPKKVKEPKKKKNNSEDPTSSGEKQPKAQKRVISGNKTTFTSDGRHLFGGVEIKKIDGLYNCGACDKNYRRSTSVKSHITEKHTVEFIRKIECGYCDKIFTSMSKFRCHERVHGGNNYICELCGAGFKQKACFTSHQLRIHNKIRNIQCEYCDRKFYTSTECNRHVRIHTGEKPYECKISGCGKRFASLGDLKIHSRAHAGVRTFKCTQCSRTFVHYTSLVRHIKSDHRKKQVCISENSEFSLPKKNNAEKEKKLKCIEEQGFQDLIQLNSTSSLNPRNEQSEDKPKELGENPESNLNLLHDNTDTGDTTETEQNNVPTNLSLHSYNSGVRTADSEQAFPFHQNLQSQGHQQQYQYNPFYYGLFGSTNSAAGPASEQAASSFAEHIPYYYNPNVSNNSYSQ